jgi:hypothetical protein
MMNWLYKRLWPYLSVIVLVTVSELLAKISLKAGLIAYGLWLLPAIFFSIRYEQHKALYVCILGAPLARLSSFIIPLKDPLLHLALAYAIFAVITGIYVFSVDARPRKPVKGWFSWAWILPVLFIVLLRIFYSSPANISLWYALVVLFASLVNAVYFNVLIQNLSEKAFSVGGIFLSTVLFFIFQLNSGSGLVFFATALIETFTLFYAYKANRSLASLFMMSALFSLMSVLFPFV